MAWPSGSRVKYQCRAGHEVGVGLDQERRAVMQQVCRSLDVIIAGD